MIGATVLMFLSGFLLGWNLSSKLNNKILKHQNKYLRGRVQILRTIWVNTGKRLPPRGEK